MHENHLAARARQHKNVNITVGNCTNLKVCTILQMKSIPNARYHYATVRNYLFQHQKKKTQQKTRRRFRPKHGDS